MLSPGKGRGMPRRYVERWQRSEVRGVGFGVCKAISQCGVELKVSRNIRLHAHLHFFPPKVGTGFSFTDHFQGYATSEDDVAQDLYRYVMQFSLW